MPTFSQLLNVQARDLAGLKVVAQDHSAYLMVRNVGGLVLENSGDVDSWEERIVPGVLVEGVAEPDVSTFPGYSDEDVIVTVWAGGSMHDVRTDQDAEVEVRFCVDPSEATIPVFEECGRCGRNQLPGTAHPAGC